MFSIKDLEHLSGIKAHTIRIWERRYDLLEPTRTDTNIRVYSNDDIQKVLNVALLNKNGYKISRLSKLSETELENKAETLYRSSNSQESIINRLVILTIGYDKNGFNKAVQDLFMKFGVERSTIDYLIPFMKKIGLFWNSSFISVSHQRFASAQIRNLFIMQTDQLNSTGDKGTFVLYLPEKEYDEHILLFVNYILQRRNYKVIYLGADVDAEEAIKTKELNNAQFMFTCIVSSQKIKLENKTFEPLIENLKSNDKLFIWGKYPAYLDNYRQFKRVVHLDSFKDYLMM